MHAGDEFGLLVAAVIDQRLMEGAEARGRVGDRHNRCRAILMTSTMKSDPSGPVALASSFGTPVSAAANCSAVGRRADGQARRRRCRFIHRRRGGAHGFRSRYSGGGAGYRNARHEFTATDIWAGCIRPGCIRAGLGAFPILAWHKSLHLMLPGKPGAMRSIRSPQSAIDANRRPPTYHVGALCHPGFLGIIAASSAEPRRRQP